MTDSVARLTAQILEGDMADVRLLTRERDRRHGVGGNNINQDLRNIPSGVTIYALPCKHVSVGQEVTGLFSRGAGRYRGSDFEEIRSRRNPHIKVHSGCVREVTVSGK